MPPAQSQEYAAVFDAFEIDADARPAESCYAYAPVFPVRVDGRGAVVKRARRTAAFAASISDWLRELDARGIPVVTPLSLPSSAPNPTQVGELSWVIYPWISGRRYDGSISDIAAAGDLVGRIHAAAGTGAGVPEFSWPEPDPESIAEDVSDLDRVFATHLPDDHDRLSGYFRKVLEAFPTETLPAIRDSQLPVAASPMDYKAVNLVYAARGPVLVDPDNVDRAPRILELAMTVLLFHNDLLGGPDRLFSSDQWSAFLSAYRRHISLTPTEITLWPVAVRYMLLEEAVWRLIDADECGDWDDPHQRRYLVDLAETREDRFALG